MKPTTILTLLGAAAQAAAAPLNATISTSSLLFKRDFEGTIDFFSRYDCTNPCVENGLCAAGQTGEGDLVSETFIGRDSECFDRPHGAHSVSFSVDNGHGFTAIDKSCKQFKDDGFVARKIYTGGSSDNSNPTCLPMNHHKVKAVFYNW